VIGASWPFGTLSESGLEELGPHVFAYYAPGYPYANSAIVHGTESTLVFDANIFHYANDLRHAMDLRMPVGSVHLVFSHSHADHVDGAMYFTPPAETWATAWTQARLAWWAGQDMTERNSEYVGGYPRSPQWYETFRLVIPEHGIKTVETIELGGGVRVHLMPEDIAHTPGDLWALVEPDNVVLCGDLWFNDCEPWLGLGALKGSLRAIDRLRRVGASAYLPGHGAAGSLGRDDKMERYCAWLAEEVATGMARGLTGRELQDKVRVDFDRQSASPDGIRFAFNWSGFVEDAVEAVELNEQQRPRHAEIPIAASQQAQVRPPS
jgi:cyclase